MVRIEEVGEVKVVHGLDIKIYHSEEEISSSQERTYWRSPELYHGRHVTKTIPPFSSSSTELGQDCHDWFETLDDSLSWLVRAPRETLTPTGQIGKKAKEWAEKEGIEGRLVSDTHFEKVRRIVDALKASTPAMELREQSVHEETSYFYKVNGLGCRCRSDNWLDGGMFADLKTTSCGNIDREFVKSVHDFGYGRQQAFYEICQEKLFGWAPGMAFIVVQTSEPYQVRVKYLPNDYVSACKSSVRRVLDEIHQRTALDHWHFDECQVLDVPKWMFPE